MRGTAGSFESVNGSTLLTILSLSKESVAKYKN